MILPPSLYIIYNEGIFMLYIRPIMDKTLQKELCERSGAIYNEDFFAYFASESADCGETIDRYLGILQFSINKSAKLETITQMPGIDDEEAMIIMARAAMSFIYRDCGIERLYVSERIDFELAEKLGFDKSNGVMDLESFFKSPCQYGKMQKNEK